LAPAFELRPGDEIRVHCVYQSLSRTETTYYGEATSDEMCFGMFAYYPAVENFTYCGQWRTVDECTNEDGYVCDLAMADPLWKALEYTCAGGCSCACKEVLYHVNTTGCMSGDAGEYLLKWYPELQQVVDLQNWCASEERVTPASTTPASHQQTLEPCRRLRSAALLVATYLAYRFL